MEPLSQDSERFWDILLSKIEEGRVIPVIGPAIVSAEVDGEADLLENHIARRLASYIGIQAESHDGKISLRDVVARAHLQNPNEDYHNEVFRILKRLGHLPPPESLQALARITDFRIYVTLTFDALLVSAIEEARGPIGADKHYVGYAPNLRQVHIPALTGQGYEPVIYALFGKACSAAEYVISDEDLLEWITALQDPDNRPQHLFDALRSNHLLFIGCALPDWLLRFLLRMTREGRVSAKKASETLIDNSIPGQNHLVAFLDRFSPRTVFINGNPNEFIQELEKRWQSQKEQALPGQYTDLPADLREGGVFISYASEDGEAASKLYESLSSRQIDTWFDTQCLRSGAKYDRVIERNIGLCGAFIVVLSRAALNRLRRWRDEEQCSPAKQPYFLKEWELALSRERLYVGSVAIYPIHIDSPDLRDTLIPEGLRKLTCEFLPQGTPKEAFLDRVKKSVREQRKRIGDGL